jgi:HEAT repeat protein
MKAPRLSFALIALSLFLSFVYATLTPRGAEANAKLKSEDIMKVYLALPHPEKEDGGTTRMARLKVLAQLSSTPDILPVIQSNWDGIKQLGQRIEVAEMIGRSIQTPAGAGMLIEWLKDPAEEVRSQAVRGMRLMARRVDRAGGARIQQGPEQQPKVEGLVPSLIVAANDASEKVRMSALYALADARDDKATQEIRNHLKDTSLNVRFKAACFLTEFQDGSGLPELCLALERLRTTDSDKESSYYFDAETLLASLERVTGKTFGKIGLNPISLSNADDALIQKGQFKKLLDSWWEFISSSEGKQLKQKLMQARPVAH